MRLFHPNSESRPITPDSSSPGLPSRLKPCAKRRKFSRLLTPAAIPVLWLPCLRRRTYRSYPGFPFASLKNEASSQNSTPRLSKSVMHIASSPHDLQSLPRLQNSCALPPIFMLRDIYAIGALVPVYEFNTRIVKIRLLVLLRKLLHLIGIANRK
jgi:hypothetical protein